MEFVSESLILSHTKFLKNAAVESLWGAGASCIVLGNPHMIIFLQSNKFVWPIIWIGKSQRRRCYLAVMFWDTAAAAINPHIIICLQFHNIDLKSEVESLRSADASCIVLGRCCCCCWCWESASPTPFPHIACKQWTWMLQLWQLDFWSLSMYLFVCLSASGMTQFPPRALACKEWRRMLHPWLSVCVCLCPSVSV